MPASDKYSVTPGFHIGEMFQTLKAIRDGFALEQATDLSGLTTCGLAALDERPDGFGDSGDDVSKTPDGRDIKSLSLDECCEVMEQHQPGEGYGATAIPPWLAAVAIQAALKALEKYLPSILDRLLNREIAPVGT